MTVQVRILPFHLLIAPSMHLQHMLSCLHPYVKDLPLLAGAWRWRPLALHPQVYNDKVGSDKDKLIGQGRVSLAEVRAKGAHFVAAPIVDSKGQGAGTVEIKLGMKAGAVRSRPRDSG
jgi:hypothetical protein